jgi:voltage-gated potassium channel
MILIKFLRKVIRSRRKRIFFFATVGLVVMLLVSSFGFWLIEAEQNLSLFDSLWLSYVTMTTVGYGDKSPLTTAGRVFAMIVAMTGGIGLVAYVITLMASTVIEWENKRMKGLTSVKCTDHYIIVNCPNQEKVLTMIEEIRNDPWSHDVPIVLISQHLTQIPDPFIELSDFHFVSGNPLLTRILERANAKYADKAIILARDPKDPASDGITTQVALTLEYMRQSAGEDLYTVAEAVSKDSIAPLKAAGVEEVICHEMMIPQLLARALLDPGASEINVELCSNRRGSQYYVGGIGHADGHTFQDVCEIFRERGHHKIIPFGIYRNGSPIINPDGDFLVSANDQLIYLADHREDLERILADIWGDA